MHVAQHVFLVLIIPALLVVEIPQRFAKSIPTPNPLATWLIGVVRCSRGTSRPSLPRSQPTSLCTWLRSSAFPSLARFSGGPFSPCSKAGALLRFPPSRICLSLARPAACSARG